MAALELELGRVFLTLYLGIVEDSSIHCLSAVRRWGEGGGVEGIVDGTMCFSDVVYELVCRLGLVLAVGRLLTGDCRLSTAWLSGPLAV